MPGTPVVIYSGTGSDMHPIEELEESNVFNLQQFLEICIEYLRLFRGYEDDEFLAFKAVCERRKKSNSPWKDSEISVLTEYMGASAW